MGAGTNQIRRSRKQFRTRLPIPDPEVMWIRPRRIRFPQLDPERGHVIRAVIPKPDPEPVPGFDRRSQRHQGFPKFPPVQLLVGRVIRTELRPDPPPAHNQLKRRFAKSPPLPLRAKINGAAWRGRQGLRAILPNTGEEAASATTVGTAEPFLGGLAWTACEWISAHAIRVSFSTTWSTAYVYQLYAGRRLIGVSVSPSARQVIGQLLPSRSPQVLTLLAVDPEDATTDFGSLLPPNAYNCVALGFTAAGMPSDTRWLEVTSGTTPGGAVSSSNVLALIPFDVDRSYEYTTDPLDGTGTWNFEIAARDNRPNNGNKGTALAISAAILSIPPDVDLRSDGSRFVLSITTQTLTVTFTP